MYCNKFLMRNCLLISGAWESVFYGCLWSLWTSLLPLWSYSEDLQFITKNLENTFSLDGQTSSLLGVCHHYSQKVAISSEIIQILISKEWLHVHLTLNLAEKQFHLTWNALKSKEHLKNHYQHNFVSFFTKVYWSGCTYMFPEAKKGGRNSHKPFSFSLVRRRLMGS